MAGILSTWVTVADRSLLVHVHHPRSGRTRGAVLICEPLYRDRMLSERTLRSLAVALADRGVLAVRFSMTGTVDSGCRRDASSDVATAAEASDSDDLARVWEEDLAAMRDWTARVSGSEDVAVVAMRMSALLAQPLLEHRPSTRLVMWAPVGSGRAWLRSLEALLLVSPHSPENAARPDDGSIDIPGTRVGPRMRQQLSALRLGRPASHRAPSNTLMVVDSELGPDKAVALWTDPEIAVVDDAPGNARMLDFESTLTDTPADTVARVADWLAGPQVPWTDVALPVVARTATVATSASGDIVEEIVDIDGMPGLLTRGPGQPRSALLFVPAAGECRDGISGLWTRSARHLAAQGVITLRLDTPGVGELSSSDGAPAPWSYRSAILDNYARAWDWLAQRAGCRPALAGSCSGAWVSVSVAARRPAPLALGANLVTTLMRPPTDPVPWRKRLHPSVTSPQEESERTSVMKSRLAKGVTVALPHAIGRVVSAADLALVPEPFLRRTARGGAAVRVVHGRSDHRLFIMLGGEPSVRRLSREGLDVVVELEALMDHALFTHDARATVVGWIERNLLGQCRA